MKKFITLDGLKIFLDELNNKYGTEFYTKAEIDEKLKSNGGSIDLKDIAERIPNFCYWLRIKQSPHQTITATCEGKEYTADVLIEKGKTVTIAVKVDNGYTAGTLSKAELTMSEDTEITATEATKNEEFEAGSLEIKNRRIKFQVPRGVCVLRASFGSASRYIKVNPEMTVELELQADEDLTPGVFELYSFTIRNPDTRKRCAIFNPSDKLTSNKGVATVSWSKEINEHATDIDFTGIS